MLTAFPRTATILLGRTDQRSQIRAVGFPRLCWPWQQGAGLKDRSSGSLRDKPRIEMRGLSCEDVFKSTGGLPRIKLRKCYPKLRCAAHGNPLASAVGLGVANCVERRCCADGLPYGPTDPDEQYHLTQTFNLFARSISSLGCTLWQQSPRV